MTDFMLKHSWKEVILDTGCYKPVKMPGCNSQIRSIRAWGVCSIALAKHERPRQTEAGAVMAHVNPVRLGNPQLAGGDPVPTRNLQQKVADQVQPADRKIHEVPEPVEGHRRFQDAEMFENTERLRKGNQAQAPQ